jgi:tetratricopeptide (TPR) repeat protein
MPLLNKVFISHSHKDEPLAAAFRDTLRNIFQSVEVAFSSDKESGGGPQSGSNWLAWIHGKMLECEEALLLLTPYSIQKPWPMWEAGAVAGMAMSGQQSEKGSPAKLVTPIRFNVSEEHVPGPFAVTQAVDGTREASLKKLLGDLMRRHDYQGSKEGVVNAVLKDYVPPLRQRILDWLRSAPSVVTEGTIAEWCARLDRLRDDKRSADVRFLHNWIRLTYDGPSTGEAEDARRWNPNGPQDPWDIRLHLRLAENYLIAGQAGPAIAQYQIATQLEPLDVFVLHKLGMAYLDSQNPAGARETIERILQLDPDALRWNAEVAGLEGRFWKDEGRRREKEGKDKLARECFEKALQFYMGAMEIEGNRISLYMVDNVGQLSLKLGDLDSAHKVYERAKAALENVTPQTEDIWSLATRATTALVLGSEDEAIKHLQRLSTRSPSEKEKTSIGKGLELVREALGKTAADYQRWMSALDG